MFEMSSGMNECDHKQQREGPENSSLNGDSNSDLCDAMASAVL